ncbi:MAG TPA: hypothetical protein VHC43_09730 [Mycobacteriales bacterium]|nr:hypothetical protein [Mycobacteriales bacterium]
MSGKTLAITALGALTVAVIGIAARPLTATTHHSAVAAPTSEAYEPAAVNTIAITAARTDLRCAPTRSTQLPPRACGALRITRHQTRCTTSSRCSVDLIGNVETRGLKVPVALTVTVARTDSTWQVIEVAS